MKKIILILLVSCGASSQNIEFVRNFVTENPIGSARFEAMSGAFGALGGDLSSFSINPAGSSVFNFSEFSGSLTLINQEHNVNYFQDESLNDYTSLDFGQLGLVVVLKNTQNGNWKKMAIGINTHLTKSYDDELFISGRNTKLSLDRYFLGFADQVNFDNIQLLDFESVSEGYSRVGYNSGYGHQQAFLGYHSYLIEHDADGFFSNASSLNGVSHRYFLDTRGYNRELNINISGQYKENWYFGANINFHLIDYIEQKNIFETDYDVDSYIKETNFYDELRTSGGGISLQLGAIFKPTETIRMGLSYESPTWYFLEDELQQYIRTSSVDDTGQSYIDIIDPQVINIYEDYTIKSPSKLTGSLAIIASKRGLISMDYTRKNYASARITPSNDPVFDFINNDIKNQWTSTNSYRIGGEIRGAGGISIRGGYHFEESPYKETNTYGDLSGYSLGLGFNFGVNALDIAYVRQERDIQHRLYDVGLTSVASSSQSTSRFTIGYKLKF